MIFINFFDQFKKEMSNIFIDLSIRSSQNSLSEVEYFL